LARGRRSRGPNRPRRRLRLGERRLPSRPEARRFRLCDAVKRITRRNDAPAIELGQAAEESAPGSRRLSPGSPAAEEAAASVARIATRSRRIEAAKVEAARAGAN